MKTRVITFHNGNLDPELLSHQMAVFDKFQIPLEQIKTSYSHPAAIDHFIDKEDWDQIILFDADCIPINNKAIPIAVETIKNNHKIFAASQKASHIPDSKIYAAPCFMAFTKKTYQHIGEPSFHATHRGDVAEEITYSCRAHQIAVELLYPTHVEVPMWDLTDKIRFGFGTTYADLVYHAFESQIYSEM